MLDITPFENNGSDKCCKEDIKDNREFTQRQEYDYDYVNGCLKGLGLIVIVIVIVSLNVGLR